MLAELFPPFHLFRRYIHYFTTFNTATDVTSIAIQNVSTRKPKTGLSREGQAIWRQPDPSAPRCLAGYPAHIYTLITALRRSVVPPQTTLLTDFIFLSWLCLAQTFYRLYRFHDGVVQRRNGGLSLLRLRVRVPSSSPECIAQLAEHLAFNQGVAGSIPAAFTKIASIA